MSGVEQGPAAPKVADGTGYGRLDGAQQATVPREELEHARWRGLVHFGGVQFVREFRGVADQVGQAPAAETRRAGRKQDLQSGGDDRPRFAGLVRRVSEVDGAEG